MAGHAAKQVVTRHRRSAAFPGDPTFESKVTAPDVPDWALRRRQTAKAVTQGARWFAVTKFRPAPLPATLVARPALHDQLTAGAGRRLTVVTGWAAAGKSVLLSNWAATRQPGMTSWLSCDEADDADPVRFWTGFIEAVRVRVPGFGADAADLLATDGVMSADATASIVNDAAKLPAGSAVIVDDFHYAAAAVSRHMADLVERWPAETVQLVLAGRADPPLRLHQLRMAGELCQLRDGDLHFSLAESRDLLANFGAQIAAEDLALLHQRSEGWVAALQMAALSLCDTTDPARTLNVNGNRFVSEYMESEFLARLSRSQRAFLTRTAVLERMSGPVCAAVLHLPRSAATLTALARSNLLLVPLDTGGQWYRYHHLFRDMLLTQLEHDEPGLAPVLRRRAAGWCIRNGLPQEALEYSIAAGDVETVARLVEQLWLPVYRQGGHGTLERWLRWLEDRGGVKGHPVIAVMASIHYACTGRPVEAERWADVVDRWQYRDTAWPGDPATEAWTALLRALLCRHGVEQMRTDAEEAARKFTAAGIVMPAPAFYRGMACVLTGDIDGGDAIFQDVVAAAEPMDAQEVLVPALCQRAMVAMAHGDWSRAEILADQAHTAEQRRSGSEEICVWAVQAALALHRGDLPAVRQHLVSAQRTRPVLTYALPHLAVQARIGLTRVHLALGDPAGARTLMTEIDQLLRRRPDLGALVGEAATVRAQIAERRGTVIPGASALTAAELRLLPQLSTQLHLHEIATEMYLSPHTVRTQAKSIYRKLVTSTRSQAVTRARELGLLDG